MAEMGFRMLDGGLVVAVHTSKAPEAAIWRAYIDAFNQSASPVFRVVVFTDGGKPTREQFARLDAARRTRKLTTLIVSANVAVRIFGTMLNAVFHFNSSFSSPESVFDALDSFGVTDPVTAQRVLEEAQAIADELSPDGHLESLATRRAAPRAH